jgi:hypothetical protein
LLTEIERFVMGHLWSTLSRPGLDLWTRKQSPRHLACAARGPNNQPGERFCGECGKPLAEAAIASPSGSIPKNGKNQGPVFAILQ